MPIEEPLHRLRPSRISFFKNYLLSALLSAFLLYLFLSGFPIIQAGIYAAIFLIAIFIMIPEIERLRNTYAITSSQAIIEEGIISRKRRSIFFNNADVAVHQNFLQRLLRYGSVTVGSSTGREHMELRMKGVRRPKELAYTIEKLIRDYSAIRTRNAEKAEKKDEKKFE